MALYIWENLREEEVAGVVEKTDATCVIPLGCIAKHGQHTPLGTDNFIAEGIIRKAAQMESVCLFPTLWMGCAAQPYAHAGQINLSRPLIHDMLGEIVAEVGRNGFYRIVIANAHGENDLMLTNFLRSQGAYKKNYQLYSKRVFDYNINALVRDLDAGAEFPTLTEEDKALVREIHDNKIPYGHACIYETSVLMALRPELVRLDRATVDSGASTGKGNYLSRVFLDGSGLNFPKGVVGHNPQCANERLGNVFVEKEAERFAKALRVIKDEKDMPERIAQMRATRPYVFNPR